MVKTFASEYEGPGFESRESATIFEQKGNFGLCLIYKCLLFLYRIMAELMRASKDIIISILGFEYNTA